MGFPELGTPSIGLLFFRPNALLFSLKDETKHDQLIQLVNILRIFRYVKVYFISY